MSPLDIEHNSDESFPTPQFSAQQPQTLFRSAQKLQELLPLNSSVGTNASAGDKTFSSCTSSLWVRRGWFHFHHIQTTIQVEWKGRLENMNRFYPSFPSSKLLANPLMSLFKILKFYLLYSFRWSDLRVGFFIILPVSGSLSFQVNSFHLVRARPLKDAPRTFL